MLDSTPFFISDSGSKLTLVVAVYKSWVMVLSFRIR